jgi:hypothetical protein
MPPEGHDPAWPDKAMFSAILLILAGFVGAAFEMARPLIEVNQDKLPVLFTNDIPFYTVSLCLIVLASGVLSLRYQAAWPAYAGAIVGIVSLGVFGLVPGLSLVAIGMMVKSHLEGEETRLDGVQLHSSQWPDKAMAASLFLVVVGAIATTQGVLLLTGHFNPILLTGQPMLAGVIGVVAGVAHFVAANRVYKLQSPWTGWVALSLGVLTMGFYLLGPIMAVVGMVLLLLAHREDEFTKHGTPDPEAPPAKPLVHLTEKPAPAKPARTVKAAPKPVARKKA